MVENMVLMEGVQRVVRVRLENEAGEILAPDGFLVYGGAFCPGPRRARFDAVREADGYVLTVPGLCEGTVPWSYQLFVAEYATGVEWLLCEGEIEVLPRYAGCGRGVDSGELELVGRVDRVTHELVASFGDSAASVALNAARAVAAREGAEAAAKQADAAATNAADQATSATNARTQAEKAQQGAEDAQQAAEKDAQAAAQAKVAAQTARIDAETAKVQSQTAEGNAKSYADSAAAAKTDAEKAANEAARSQVAAQNATTDAETAKSAAQTAEGNAKVSANAAAADKEAAAQAKQDAQAAQTKAEQEAAKAEQNAALLGDAALKGADNTFTGTNTFSGSITGSGDIGGVSLDAMLGADFRKFEWVETLEQLYAVCPNWQELETWYYHCPKLWQSPFQSGKTSKKLKTFYWYSEAAMIHERVILLDDVADWRCVIVLPKVTDLGNGKIIHKGYPYKHASTYELYAPLATSGKVASYATPRRFKLVSKHTALRTNEFQNSSGAENLEVLDAPLNVLKTVDMPEFSGLRQVRSPFPVATTINFNGAKLDAESALLIVSNLQQYNAETMSKLPTLTIGIHIDHQSDDEVITALETASAAVEDGGKGWVVAVAWNGTATASTFALRPAPPLPVYAKVDTFSDEEGTEHRSLRWCHQITSPDGREPEELGYTMFESVEAAREYFNLPEPEEIED